MEQQPQKKFSKKDLEKLLDLIRVKNGKDLTDAEISIKCGYNSGYISQIRSREHIPSKFMHALMNTYKVALNNSFVLNDDGGGDYNRKRKNKIIVPDSQQFLVEKLIQIIATQRVLLKNGAEIRAHQSGKDVTSVLTDLSRAVTDETSVVISELQRG